MPSRNRAWLACTLRWPRSRTSVRTTSTTTARWRSTGRPKPGCSGDPGSSVINVGDEISAGRWQARTRAPCAFPCAPRPRPTLPSRRSSPLADGHDARSASHRSDIPFGLSALGRSSTPKYAALVRHSASLGAVFGGCGASLGVGNGRAWPAGARGWTGDDVVALVDYAHTPDAVLRVVEMAHAPKPRYIVSVLGCGGDRDRNKRPLMGQAAAQRADEVWITTDNPRSEDPAKIAEEVRLGTVGTAAASSWSLIEGGPFTQP